MQVTITTVIDITPEEAAEMMQKAMENGGELTKVFMPAMMDAMTKAATEAQPQIMAALIEQFTKQATTGGADWVQAMIQMNPFLKGHANG